MKEIVPASMFAAASAKRERTRRRRLSDDELKARLTHLWQKEGYLSGPLIRDCPQLPGPETIVRRLGSLNQLCRLIGYEKPFRATRDGMRKVYSDDDLINEPRRIYGSTGNLTAKLINRDHGTPSASYFKRRLGGMRSACILAGAPALVEPYKRRYSYVDGSGLSDEQLIEVLRPLFHRQGYLTGAMIDADRSCPSSWFYVKAFGGLAEAYAKVGFCGSRGEIMRHATHRRYARLQGSEDPQTHSE